MKFSTKGGWGRVRMGQFCTKKKRKKKNATMIRMVHFIQKISRLKSFITGGVRSYFGLIVRFYSNFILTFFYGHMFKNMADNNLFFKVPAELGYFKCFYILLFFPLILFFLFLKPCLRNALIFLPAIQVSENFKN